MAAGTTTTRGGAGSTGVTSTSATDAGGPRAAGAMDQTEHQRLSALAPTSLYGITDQTADQEATEARRQAAAKLVEDGHTLSRSGMEDGENVIYVVAEDGIHEDRYVVGARGGVSKS